MKDAASEANMTVLAIILIAVIAAVVTPIIKTAMDNTAKKAECTNQGLCCADKDCTSCTECTA